MKAYVVVEGPSDASILQTVIPRELLREIILTPGGGRSNIASIARTLLVSRRRPVAVFGDADTIDERLFHERIRSIKELLESVAAGLPTKVILVVPEIEILFFQAPRVLPRLFGDPLPEEVRQMAITQPKKALDCLFKLSRGPNSIADLLHSFDHEELGSLRATPAVKELIEFLRESVKPTPKTTLV